MALETQPASIAALVQTQHQGFTQLLQTFDGRVHEHEALVGVNPITGKACGKRKRTENGKPLYTTATPVNDQEMTLLAICDKDCVLLDIPNATDRFMALFAIAKTEPDQAKLLHVLGETAKKAVHSASVVEAFEAAGGMKTAKVWLESAVSFNQTTFLHLVLTVLKALPVTLASITEARINEPIVALRKSPPNDVVKRSAQELLKSWRTKFTEKAPPKESSSPPSKQTSPTAAAAAPAASTRVPTKSNTLLTNLLMKPKDNKPTKAKDMTLTKMLQQKQIKDKEAPPSGDASPVGKGLALPAIVSFGDVKTTDAPAVTSSKRIRWADNHGKDLTQVRLIESWRDMVYHTEADDAVPAPAAAQHHDSFKDAKLREHANEKSALRNKHTERLSAVKPTMEWRSPVTIQMPPDVAGRPADHATDETTLQTNRTRKDVEWILLGTEVPPPTPHEWTRSAADVFLGPATVIPLSDGSPEEPAHEEFTAAPAEPLSVVATALGSLEKTTIALLLDNEYILPQVYDEVLRSGRRITDARIREIIDLGRRGPPAQPHYGAAPSSSPPPQQNYRHNYSTDTAGRNTVYDGYSGAPNKRPFEGYTDPAAYAQKRHQPAAPMYSPPPSYSPESDANFGRQAPPPSDRSRFRVVPCVHYRSARGCKNGDSCTFIHEGPPGPQRGPAMPTGRPLQQFNGAPMYGRGGYGVVGRSGTTDRGY
ncbi:hypothetical protein ACHHYP_12274 [Achlya hypogyna]|uniref:Serine/threonine-protein phosphatase 1 regulatory subunit 10 n=1 Tax=Achlya hypogyna TaxID=1202772 RepID=A0A1V9YHC6_ACHHY|nr:hypothetical protein ACHHYP_12274 [Achlya hypogyna]